MILVADASALIALSACKSLSVLDALFGTVLVPEAVYLEVAAGDKPEAEPLRHYLQDKIRQVDMRHFVYLDAYADAGETAAMLLYKELNADYHCGAGLVNRSATVKDNFFPAANL